MPAARCTGGHVAGVTAKIPWKGMIAGDYSKPVVLELSDLELRFEGLLGTEGEEFFKDRARAAAAVALKARKELLEAHDKLQELLASEAQEEKGWLWGTRKKQGGGKQANKGPEMHVRVAQTAVIEITNVRVLFTHEGVEAEVSLGRLALPVVKPPSDEPVTGPLFQRSVCVEALAVRVGEAQLLHPTSAGADLFLSTSSLSLKR